jgi:hypothetical protein
MQTSPFTKTIEMQFAKVGKRTKLAGFIGQITDESGIVLHSNLYATKPEAEQALDALVHELLTDYAERGLVDTLPTCESDDPFADPRSEDERRESVEEWIEFAPCDDYPFGGWEKPHVHPFDDTRTVMVRRPRLFATPDPQLVNWNSATALTTAQRLAQSLATLTGIHTHVVQQGAFYLVQDECDIEVYGGRAAIVATFAPQADDDEKGIDTEPESPPVYPAPNGRAVTLQSLAIEARIVTCPHCSGIHHIQKCPEIAATMAAQLTPVELGAALCGWLWCDAPGFVRMLRRSTPARRAAYAAAYIAFLRSERGWCDMTIADVVARWMPAPVLERAA